MGEESYIDPIQVSVCISLLISSVVIAEIAILLFLAEKRPAKNMCVLLLGFIGTVSTYFLARESLSLRFFIPIAAEFLILYWIDPPPTPHHSPIKDLKWPFQLLVATAVLIISVCISSKAIWNDLYAWEGDVSLGITTALKEWSLVDLFKRSLLWEPGLMSAGQYSFFFGNVAFAFTAFFGASILALRLISLTYFVLSIGVIFTLLAYLYGRRHAFFGSLFLLSVPPALYYATYISSPSATFLSLVLAVFSYSYFVVEEKISWITSVGIAVSFIIATLHYSPARPIVCILVVGLFFEAVRQRAHKTGSISIIALFFISFLYLQLNTNHIYMFASARGEQIFQMLPPKLIEWRPQIESGGAIVKYSLIVEYLWSLISVRFVELADILARSFNASQLLPNAITVGDPPVLPLFSYVQAPFVCLGLILGACNRKDEVGKNFIFSKIMLLALLTIVSVTMLTTRVDVHRLYVALVPLTFFYCWGLSKYCDRSILYWGSKITSVKLPLIALLGFVYVYDLVGSVRIAPLFTEQFQATLDNAEKDTFVWVLGDQGIRAKVMLLNLNNTLIHVVPTAKAVEIADHVTRTERLTRIIASTAVEVKPLQEFEVIVFAQDTPFEKFPAECLVLDRTGTEIIHLSCTLPSSNVSAQ